MEYTSRITLEDAKTSGHMKEGSGWATYPANMLRWRALGFAIDVVFPDIQGGMKRADEFGATVDAEGEIVEVQWNEVPAQPQQLPSTQDVPVDTQAVGPAPEALSIQTLIDSHGAEAVLAAMQTVTAGAMPDNQDQVDAIAKELANDAK